MMSFLPPAESLMKTLRITQERLGGEGRVAVPLPVLRKLLMAAVRSLPFDEAVYLKMNADVAEARARGAITDLHEHFVAFGYFEGRVASEVIVDEDWYLATYPDVAQAIAKRDTASATAHYLTNGAAEGRSPTPELASEVDQWRKAMQAW